MRVRRAQKIRNGWWTVRLLVTGGLLVGGPGPALAQNASVQGIVTDRLSRAALDGVSVALERVGDPTDVRGSATDVNGFYQIGGVPPGDYTLRMERIGYVMYEQLVTFAPGGFLTVSAGLDTSPVVLEGITVEPLSGAAERELGRLRIRPIDIGRIPAPSASGDLASFLQTLPGVVTTGDRGGQLFIRGGTPDQNLVMVDGLLIYQPFHILGFFSVFPEDLVSSVDFYASGFGSRYVGRSGSVIDVRMRDGNRTDRRTSGSVSPFLAEAVAEGPIKDGGASWIASVRRSLIEETSPALLGQREPLTFGSQYVKVSSVDDDTGSRCSAMVLHTADRGSLDVEIEGSLVGWSNLVLGGRCIMIFDSWLRLADVTFGYSRVRNDANSRGVAELTSGVSRLHHEAHATSLWGTTPIYVGYTMNIELVEYDLRELFGVQQSARGIWGMSGYGEAELTPTEDVTVRPGFVFTLLPRAGIEPRVRASWRPLGRGTEEVSAALGLYRQDLVGVSDTRDVSSVFVAWQDVDRRPPLSAVHASLGWQQALGRGLAWSLEGYTKWLDDVPIAVWRANAGFTTSLSRADGRVYGADLRLEYRRPGFYGFLGYGYTWTEYRATQLGFAEWFGEPVQRYHPPHDRRHQLNAVVSADIGPYSTGARWQMGSGLPYTRPAGFDEVFDFRIGLPVVQGQSGVTRLVLDRPYQARLPAVHRLDLWVRRPFELDIGTLEVQAGVLNVYDRRNLFFYDLYTGRRVDQLPIVPYLSFKLERP